MVFGLYLMFLLVWQAGYLTFEFIAFAHVLRMLSLFQPKLQALDQIVQLFLLL